MPFELEQKIIAAGYRRLAKDLHPDKPANQNTALQMVELNAARDRLKQLIYAAMDAPAQQAAAQPQTWAEQYAPARTPPPPIFSLEEVLKVARQDPIVKAIYDLARGIHQARKKRKRRA